MVKIVPHSQPNLTSKYDYISTDKLKTDGCRLGMVAWNSIWVMSEDQDNAIPVSMPRCCPPKKYPRLLKQCAIHLTSCLTSLYQITNWQLPAVGSDTSGAWCLVLVLTAGRDRFSLLWRSLFLYYVPCYTSKLFYGEVINNCFTSVFTVRNYSWKNYESPEFVK